MTLRLLALTALISGIAVIAALLFVFIRLIVRS